MPHPRRNHPAALTLIEVIVVVAIVAILAAVVVPRLVKRPQWPRPHPPSPPMTAARAVKAIETVVYLYHNDTGKTLTSNFDLAVLLLPAEDDGGPQGPYLQKADDLVDPWGNPYVIRVPGELNEYFDIVSWGADGMEGTDDDIVS